MHWVSRSGEKGPRLSTERSFAQVEMSRDGSRLGLVVRGANNVLWSYDPARDQMTRVTFRFDIEAPAWTRDSAHLTYWTGSDVRTSRADGSGSEKVIIPATQLNGRAATPESWSEGDQTLAVSLGAPRQSDVALYSVRDQKLKMFSATRFDEFGARFSPDGKWLAFVSDHSGRPEVFVQSVEGSDSKHQVSQNGSDTGRWTANGRELIISSQEGPMAVSFMPGPTPVTGTPALLFKWTSADPDGNLRGLEPTPDGKRCAALYNNPLPPLTEIRVVTNWLPDLARVR